MKHEPLPIFISYANYDNSNDNQEERWLARLLQHLNPLNIEGLVLSYNFFKAIFSSAERAW